MNVTSKIKTKINRIEPGRIFSYKDLGISNSEYVAAAKAIGRIVKEGKIKRASTGLFYKPQKTVFGELKPSEQEQLRPYLFNGRKRIAYVTGLALFNRLNLTTQVPKDINLASRVRRPVSKVGNMEVRWVKSYVDVTNKNYFLLEILDSIKDFKKIPDLDKKAAIKRLQSLIIDLEDSDKKRLVEYAQEYPPRVRAFLGALLEQVGQRDALHGLKKSINSLTTFKLGISDDILPNSRDWFIR
ncbi:MAG: DUF6088 family protein [Desulfovibrionales bacterium]|nr:DUF6088 family protein [Desulfovibrionales bacterium]